MRLMFLMFLVLGIDSDMSFALGSTGEDNQESDTLYKLNLAYMPKIKSDLVCNAFILEEAE